ncbi:MAG TPA: T9SS type A sorting domain-containing protein [Williamwhitmania sp.]|nr:T9SS type A sorting domain-containing protein [Williamwhitmania sp.]
MKTFTYACLFALLTTAAASASGQNIGFTYDASGNRVERLLITLKVPQAPGAATDTTGKEPLVPISFKDLRVFPNPTQGLVTVDYPNFTDGDVITYAVYSSGGQLVMQGRSATSQLDLDFSTKPAGIYIVKLSKSGATVDMQVVKQ